MTCIIGAIEDGVVYVGGDSAGVAGLSLTVRADEKVFVRDRRREPWIFGFTSSFRMGQLIRYKLALPETPDEGDLHEFMSGAFVDALRQCLKDGGWMGKDEDRDRGGTFVVGLRGQLFTIYGDFQVAEAADSYVGVGCGADLALGAMHALTTNKVGTAEERIEAALDAAERFSAGVRAPFVIRSIGAVA